MAMIHFRPDTTFPFLAIARQWGVPYGKVLEIAERVECFGRPVTGDILTARVAEAVFRERSRRKLVTASV